MQDELEFSTQVKDALADQPYYLPFKQPTPEIKAIALTNAYSELDSFLRETASGYLNTEVFQEIVVSDLADSDKTQFLLENYQNKPLLVSRFDIVVDKILNFKGDVFVVDVIRFRALITCPIWQQIYDHCIKEKNSFLVLGTLLNFETYDRYIHHQDIPAIDIATLVPQHLADTGEAPEMNVGLLGKRNLESKKRSMD